MPLMMQKVLPEIFGEENRSLIKIIGAALFMPAVFLLRGVSSFFNKYLVAYCGNRVLEYIQVDLFSRVQMLPLQFFHSHKSGDLIARMRQDTQRIRDIVVNASNDVITQPMQLLGALGFLVYMSIEKNQSFFLLVCLATIPLCVFPIRLIGLKILRRSEAESEQAGGLTAYIADGLQAPMDIRAYNMQSAVVRNFHLRALDLFKVRMKVVKYNGMLGPIIEFVSACGIAVTIVYAGNSNMDFQEDILPMMMALYMSYGPIKKLGQLHKNGL